MDFLAGVKEKDEVLEVNGTDISMLRLHDVRKLLLGPAGLVLALCAGFFLLYPNIMGYQLPHHSLDHSLACLLIRVLSMPHYTMSAMAAISLFCSPDFLTCLHYLGPFGLAPQEAE